MNDLSVYERISDPLAAIQSLGEAIAKSRIFGCESIDQGKVLAWECLARRTPPLQLKETYHLINTGSGTALTMRADAMLAGFIREGGRHRIIQRDGERAAVELTYGGQSVVFECSYAEAKEAGLTAGKKGEKENWSSPRQRMQMLWARAVSDGVRAMAPQVCAGKYTPEEFGQAIADAGEPATIEQAATVVDTTATVVEQPPVEVAEATTPVFANSIQTDKIRGLFDELKISPDQQAEILKKRGINSLRSLTFDQAADLIRKLEAKANQVKQTETTAAVESSAGETRLPDTATVATWDGPCTAAQIDLAKQLVTEIEQVQPGTVKRIREKLAAAGFAKISELSMSDCDHLLRQLGMKNLETFWARELAKPDQSSPEKN